MRGGRAATQLMRGGRAATRWSAFDIPSQTGRVAVITGANSGIGFCAARELARQRAHVVLACRDPAKGERAAAAIGASVPAPSLQVEQLDLASLASVRAFAARLRQPQIDLLINNAGVMAPPRRLTADGFELQLGVNHLGHFALTGLLLARLLAAPEPRVVTVSSLAHRGGRIAFDDLQSERRYDPWRAYGQSKLANLMFCFEFQRRATAAGTALRSLAAHPGYAATNLQLAGPRRWWERLGLRVANRLFAQSAEMGALPVLYAASVPELAGGTFVGPGGVGQVRGRPRVVGAARHAYDREVWRRLWEVSERLTGVRYEFAAKWADAAA
jgi:NAD(P)-dependent dehydrogenase (short-subunit alcohol dehydrogenase family)